jgi:hypothetical protein
MIKIRVLHEDGRDEVYEKVAKTTITFDEFGSKILVIYTQNMTIPIHLQETTFVQHWATEAE